ncbi:alpha/beta hydrolase [Actinocorallia aurantiaca]|uniref:Alpha/beta hydrolase n=2 Tax=Actinocorallia aurantiaca TaxID=46204 RepID=A0ABP6GM35_9ACTN
MRRRALITATVMLLSLAAFTPASSALSPGPERQDPTQRVAAQKLKWTPCFKRKVDASYRRLQCADIKVPLDWKKPNGKKITLAISRLKARKKPKGVVFTNPGGPGAPGWSLPLVFVDANRTRLLDTMDIIGIDVRGTGYSTQASCRKVSGSLIKDTRNRSAANIEHLLALGEKFAKSCQDSGSKKLPSKYVTTAQTVYDLEWIRRNLKTSDGKKVKKIHWVGYSAGTWLGAYYARKWPKATGRFVLDSVTDFSGTWQADFDRQAKGFQDRFHQFARWAARHDGEFALGTSQKAVVAKYEEIRAGIVEQGWTELEYYDGGTVNLYPSGLDSTIMGALYSKYDFSDLGYFLAALSASAGQGARKRPPAGLAQDPDAGYSPTFDNIVCNDTPNTRGPSALVAYTEKTGAKYPLTGYDRITDPCAHWKKTPGQLKLPRPAGRGLPRLLMIQSVLDPATPYSGAVKAHKAYGNSRLITVKNEGDHAIYAGDNLCVDTLVEKYLIDGVYPKKDRTCAGIAPPAPRGEGMRARDRAVNPLLRVRELAGLRFG